MEPYENMFMYVSGFFLDSINIQLVLYMIKEEPVINM